MVRMALQVGLQLVVENEAVAPKGSPDAEKETDPVTPDNKEAVMVFEPDDPCPAVMPPELERAI